MGIYLFGRNFVHAHFIKPLLDFCAVNNPKLYEYIFYNISHKFRREDCGDAFFFAGGRF